MIEVRLLLATSWLALLLSTTALAQPPSSGSATAATERPDPAGASQEAAESDATSDVTAQMTDQMTDQVIDQAIEQVRSGDLNAAIKTLETVAIGADAPTPAVAMLGGLYVEEGRFQEAHDLLQPLAESDDADPAVLYNAGRAAIALGDPETAFRDLSRSVEIEPRSPARRELGLLLGRMDRNEEAYALLRPWAFNHPDDFDARLAAAAIAVQLERVPDLERLLTDLPSENPGVAILWGQTLLLKGDPWGALGYLQPLEKDAPPALATDAKRLIAKVYVQVGEAERAVALLEPIAAGDPSASMQLAQAYYQSGKIDQALATLGPFAAPLTATDVPENPPKLAKEMVLEYGRLLSTAARHAEALPYLRLATRLSPERPDAWQALGQALAATGDREAAKSAIERSQELAQRNEVESVNQIERDLEDPTGREIRAAVALFEAGQSEDALFKLSREATLAPEDPRPPLMASRLLLLMKRNEEALGAAETALAIDRSNPDAIYQRGAVMIALGRLDEAEKQLRANLETAPNHVPSLSDLAAILMSRDQNAEARLLLKRVLEIRPGDTIATQGLKRLDG